MMRRCGPWLLAGAICGAALASAPVLAQERQTPAGENAIAIELNSLAAAAPGRCRLTFVVANRGMALASLKLDLAAFGPDGAIERRVAAELGPLRADKTQVKAFDIEAACERVANILVNDVTACAPVAPDACLDRLALSHRGAVRLFK